MASNEKAWVVWVPFGRARHQMHAFHSSCISTGPLAIAPDRQSAARQKTRKTASFVSGHKGWEKHGEETQRTIQDIATFSACTRKRLRMYGVRLRRHTTVQGPPGLQLKLVENSVAAASLLLLCIDKRSAAAHPHRTILKIHKYKPPLRRPDPINRAADNP